MPSRLMGHHELAHGLDLGYVQQACITHRMLQLVEVHAALRPRHAQLAAEAVDRLPFHIRMREQDMRSRIAASPYARTTVNTLTNTGCRNGPRTCGCIAATDSL